MTCATSTSMPFALKGAQSREVWPETYFSRTLARSAPLQAANNSLDKTFLGKSHSGINTLLYLSLCRLQALVLAMYHLQVKSGGLARNGFFHWRHHLVDFIDRNWSILFPADIKARKKKWVGTVAGRLSHYSGYLLVSGSKTVFNKPAWWTLMYPKITPLVLSTICELKF